MASKTIDEILKNMPPESRAAIEKMSPETKNAVKQTGQGLDKHGIAEKPEHQENGRRSTQTRSSEPSDQMPKHQQPQRGAQKIEQAKTEMQTKAAELTKTPEKSAPTQAQIKTVENLLA